MLNVSKVQIIFDRKSTAKKALVSNIQKSFVKAGALDGWKSDPD